MILPFQTQFKDGTPTHFIQKIWCALIRHEIVLLMSLRYYRGTKGEFAQKNIPDDPFEVVSFMPKLHTIREDIHDRWHEGRLIHPVVFNRSKNQFQFAPAFPCKSTQKIEIIRTSDYLNETIVKVDGRKLSEKEVQQLAWNDGFSNLIAFWLWFQNDFTGKIIHWTNLKY
jgi:hypothetical protein